MINGVKNDINEKILAIFEKYNNLSKVILYGSRARNDYKDNSDIDLALIYKEDNLLNLKIMNDLDEINTLLKFDVINYNMIDNLKLKLNIDKEGIVIFERE